MGKPDVEAVAQQATAQQAASQQGVAQQAARTKAAGTAAVAATMAAALQKTARTGALVKPPQTHVPIPARVAGDVVALPEAPTKVGLGATPQSLQAGAEGA